MTIFPNILAFVTIASACLLPVHAQMSTAEMQNARSILAEAKQDIEKKHANEKDRKIPLLCPTTPIPTSLIRTQESYDDLETKLKAHQRCVMALNLGSSDSKSESLLDIKADYPKVSPEQSVELQKLAAQMYDALRRQTLLDLQSVTEKATEVSRPFRLSLLLKESVHDELDACFEPYITSRELAGVKTYLMLYEVYDTCLRTIATGVDEWDSDEFVEKKFPKASKSLTEELKAYFNAIQKENYEYVKMHMIKADNSARRFSATEFVESDGKSKLTFD